MVQIPGPGLKVGENPRGGCWCLELTDALEKCAVPHFKCVLTYFKQTLNHALTHLGKMISSCSKQIFCLKFLFALYQTNKLHTFAEKEMEVVRGAPPPPPPPIIFEGRNLPQQAIYHWKGNLSKSPIHFRPHSF